MDETCECASSGIMVMKFMREDLLENDFCIHILRSEGLLGGSFHTGTDAAAGDTDTTSVSSCSRLCKTCGHLDTSSNLLICDHCEEAFHPSCFGPCFTRLPADEWFCHSCLKRKRKSLMETIATKPPSIISEIDRCGIVSVKGELNPTELMLKDTETYITGVGVGKGFQAEVPDWSGPIKSDDGVLAELLEQDPSESVIDGAGGADGTICGKWHRYKLHSLVLFHL
ncbi:PHD and RING finger domain-containing protein [Quillaja saponaria]|uniref:PHD and RING finger domain-containing protein n=1 Tax=Quillaja saponaria TaxID=32244 RepID=A0AAD7L2Z0_QUISA|nr:PHD and RING finger domain-containing protein [Quillaja saponaria]